MKLLALIISLLSLSGCVKTTAEANDTAVVVISEPVDSTLHLRLLFAGDLMQHDAQIKAAKTADGTYNYDSYFHYVKPEIKRAHVAIANLEVTMGGKPYKGYPCFSAPDEYLSAIKDAGFDLLFTSNNHCCDTGKKGLKRTIEMCDSLGIPHVGTYMNQEERDSQYPYLLQKNGFRIVLLNYTYGTNGLPVPAPFVVNKLDTVQMKLDIEKAKAMNPDMIIAVPHWGIEYELTPRKSMVKMAEWMIAQGVDHVIGGHPHVVQPIEYKTDSLTGKKHLVAYSLGNMVSDQGSFPRYGGMMVALQLRKAGPNSPAEIADCGYTLHFVSRAEWNREHKHIVYPVNAPDSLLNATEKNRRDEFVKTARDLFAKHNIGIEEYEYQYANY